MPTFTTETITAQATPPGYGGIAIVRLSGPLVKSIMQSLLQINLPPRQAVKCLFLDAQQTPIDEGIALFFPAPHSFTGEDVLELQGHGSPVVVSLILQRLLTLGARLARPGEFSERAFLNNKLDLTQAEAIADLIHATSTQAARLSMRSLQGEFSKTIHALVEQVIHVRMYIEAAIDFTDEDIDLVNDTTLLQQLEHITTQLTHLIQHGKVGRLLREGIQVVIVGAPNVGKSSLLNSLSEADIAIVTDIPGTTRDVLRQHIQIDGLPLHIMDTAGLRHSEDKVEQEGIRRAHKETEQADLVLYITTANEPLPTRSHLQTQLKNCRAPLMLIQNKIDLTQETPGCSVHEGLTVVRLSAKSGAGIDDLKTAIKQQVGFETEGDGIFLARLRHLEALANALTSITKSEAALKHATLELAAEDLRLAQLALSEITGEFTSDDLLGKIFGHFCIGK